jgi:hypothetical protein
MFWLHFTDWQVRAGQSLSRQQGSTPTGQSLLSIEPLQSLVRQKRVAALVTSPLHADEPMVALVRFAPLNSALVSVELESLAPHRLALLNLVAFIDEPDRSMRSRSRPLKLQLLRLEPGPGLAQFASMATVASSGEAGEAGFAW